MEGETREYKEKFFTELTVSECTKGSTAEKEGETGA
jgi:hypothetical protein